MTQKHFVCANHIQWLKNHTQEILPSWNNVTEQGIYFLDRAMWTDAIPPLGCSYELAELYLELHLSQDKNLSSNDTDFFEPALTMFSTSTKRFLFTLIQSDQDSLASKTIDQTNLFIQRLKKQALPSNCTQLSDLSRTLKIIRFTKNEYLSEPKTSFFSPLSPDAQLVMQ